MSIIPQVHKGHSAGQSPLEHNEHDGLHIVSALALGAARELYGVDTGRAPDGGTIPPITLAGRLAAQFDLNGNLACIDDLPSVRHALGALSDAIDMWEREERGGDIDVPDREAGRPSPLEAIDDGPPKFAWAHIKPLEQCTMLLLQGQADARSFLEYGDAWTLRNTLDTAFSSRSFATEKDIPAMMFVFRAAISALEDAQARHEQYLAEKGANAS
jgi:hypothetical protein